MGFAFATSLLIAGALVGCSYEALTAAETDVVLTIKDGDRDYGRYVTYALSEEILDLCGVLPSGQDKLPNLGGAGGRSGLTDEEDCREVPDDYDAAIVAAVVRNMDKAGYKRVAGLDQDPDLVVLLGVIARNNWQYQPAYPWCDPYYSYNCWYPTGGYVYNLPTGAVVINVIDRNESGPDALKSIWFASIQGLYATSSQLTTQDRIDKGVDTAFAQSPYLRAGSEK